MSDAPMSGPIVVTGMHGSLVRPTGALLSQLGMPLIGAGEGGAGDPAGIGDFHRGVLSNSRGSEEGWLSPSGAASVDRSALADFEQAALDAVSEAMSAGARGWADPRSTLLLDWLDDRIGAAAYVLVYRPPWDVQRSLEHTGVAPEVVLRTWTAWNEAILDFLDRHHDRCVLIEGGGVVSDPVSVVGAVEEGLGIALDTGHSPRDRAAWIWTAAARVADRRRYERRADIEPVHKLLDGLPVQARLLLGELDRRAAAVDTTAPPLLVDLVPERPGRSTAAAVIVTCRDDGWLLVDALASVRCCRADGIETLVVDRGSTDPRTIQVLEGVEAVGVSVVRTTSPNLAEARNTGLAATVSPVVMFLDAPDLLRPGFITEAAARLEAGARLAVVGCATVAWRDGDDREAGDPPSRAGYQRLADEAWHGGGALWREAVSDAGGFDTDLGAAQLGQWDLELALQPAGWEITRLDAIGLDRRPADTCATGAEVSSASTPMGRVIAKHRAFLASSPSAATELLEAADAVLALANDERDRATAALVGIREKLVDLRRRYDADVTAGNDRVIAADARTAAMGRLARTLEERVAGVTDEVVRREQAAEAARARAADEHARRLAESREADHASQESARLGAELSAIHSTKLWRWSVRPRQIYRLLRRLTS